MKLNRKWLIAAAIVLVLVVPVVITRIAATIVAIGTSLPELIASLVAAVRGHGDVALGNVIGSCLYNILGIGGFTAIVAPSAIPEALIRFDLPVLLAASGIVIIAMLRGRHIWRTEGALLLTGYAAYLWFLIPA